MKKIILSCLLLSFALVGSAQERVTVEGAITNSKSLDGRGVYLIVIYDSQADIIDSCVIRDNKYSLSGILPFNEEMLGEVVIEDEPRAIPLLRLNPNKHITVDYDPNSTDIYPNAIGSSASEEMYRYGKFLQNITINHISKFRQQQKEYQPKDTLYLALKDSITIYRDKIELADRVLLAKTSSALNAITAYMSLRYKLPADSLPQMLENIKERFPKSINLTMITGVEVAPTTPHSTWVYNRRSKLMGDVPMFMEVIELVRDNDQIELITEVNAIGDLVSDLTLPGMANNESLHALTTPYILVDFWASWCAPCREETPHLKRALADNPDQLSIYAVSIDSNLNSWKAAIEKDESQAFTHTILRRDNPQYDALSEQFGLQQIPRNYLLDKDRRIIAIDLRGEELSKKMRELTGR